MSSASPGRPAVVYDGVVQRADLDVWESDLRDLIARIRPLWYRTESKQHAEQYIRGLLSQLERKNAWAIAEYAGEPAPTALQRLLNLSPWDVEALLAVNREMRWSICPTRVQSWSRTPPDLRRREPVGRGPATILGDPGTDR